MKKISSTTVILLCGALTAIAPFSIDTYLPGFSRIADDLQTDISHVTLSLTSFFVGISFGQLLYGPTLDRFGRKRPLLFGLALYSVASIGCVFATSVQWLIAMRLMQALGGCAGMVASRAIIRDTFPPNEIAHVISIQMLIMGVAPIVAPTLGGMTVSSLGWRAIFIGLTCFGALLLTAVSILLPMTSRGNPAISLSPIPVLKSYWQVFRDSRFLPWALGGGFGTAGLFAYISGASFVFMELLRFNATQFGWLFGLNACGLIAASQLNRLFLRRWSSAQIVWAGISVQFLTGACLLSGALSGHMPRMGVPVLIFVYLFCQGMLVPNSTALALHPFSHNAGAASALIGFLGMVLGALASGMVSKLHNGTSLPMSGVMAFCSGLSLLTLLLAGKRSRHLQESVASS